MDIKNNIDINDKFIKHEIAINEIKTDIKYQLEDVKNKMANLPHQIQQEIALLNAERDEQKRKDQKETIRYWIINMVTLLGLAVGGVVWVSKMFYDMHEETIEAEHTAKNAETVSQTCLNNTLGLSQLIANHKK